MVEQFPEGKLTANAYYWLGEVHAARPEPDYERARQALVQVIDYFPESRKVPDAAFKLGKIYHLMGDCERAKETLSRVARDHSGKSVGNLARSYLNDKVDCGG
ncbi:MAG: tetratricopeptide repeat protein [Gammaproteobacteria bacterium]|nr:tetratricopeptide repeat protein [Gammaproteobacteria bacterium]